MSTKPHTTTKQIRIQVPTHSFVHADGKSTSPPARVRPGGDEDEHGNRPLEQADTVIRIVWFDDDRTQPNFVNRLTDAVGTIAYLERIRAYWAADLAGRLGALTCKAAASDDHSTVYRIFSLEIPSDSYMSIDIQKFDLTSAPSVAGDPTYHVDLPYLSRESTLAQITAALGHLSLLGFLISIWHEDLWMRMGYEDNT